MLLPNLTGEMRFVEGRPFGTVSPRRWRCIGMKDRSDLLLTECCPLALPCLTFSKVLPDSLRWHGAYYLVTGRHPLEFSRFPRK